MNNTKSQNCTKPGEEKLGPVDAEGGWQYGQVLQVVEQVLIVKLQDVQPHVSETPDGVTMTSVINFAWGHKRGRRLPRKSARGWRPIWCVVPVDEIGKKCISDIYVVKAKNHRQTR